MGNQKKYRIAFLLLIAISIYGGFIAYDISTPTTNAVEESPLIITGLKVTNYDVNGQALKKFRTAKLVHFEKVRSSQLTNPVIDVTHQENTWHITAQSGQTFSGNEKVKLYGNVQIKQKNGTQIQRMETELLWYYPKQHLAITDELIHYKRDNDIAITSKGMRANLDSKHIELLHQVKATYSQNSKHENT